MTDPADRIRLFKSALNGVTYVYGHPISLIEFLAPKPNGQVETNAELHWAALAKAVKGARARAEAAREREEMALKEAMEATA